jgi:hypothetical protein
MLFLTWLIGDLFVFFCVSTAFEIMGAGKNAIMLPNRASARQQDCLYRVFKPKRKS